MTDKLDAESPAIAAGRRLVFAAEALLLATRHVDNLTGERGNVTDAIEAWRAISAPDQIADHANCSVGEELVERVSRALHHSERGPVKSDEWRLYVPAARAALAAMPTPAAIRADERGRVVAIMRDVIRSFQECDGYELAGQMRIRLDRLTGGGE